MSPCENITNIPIDNKLSIKVCTSSSIELETGGSVWHAGLSLANHLVNHESLVRDKIILEIGSGCAIPGIVAGLLGARTVVLTDIPEQMSHLQKVIDMNSRQCPSCVFVCVPFTFGESYKDLYERLSKFDSIFPDLRSKLVFDIVFGSDIAFDVSLHTPLATSINSLLSIASKVVLVEEVRWKDIYQWFLETLSDEEFKISVDNNTVINIDSDLGNAVLRDISLLKNWILDNISLSKQEVRMLTIQTADRF